MTERKRQINFAKGLDLNGNPLPVDTRTPEQKAQDAYDNGNIGGASGAYNAVNDSGRAQFDYMHELGSPGTFGTPRTVLNTMGEGVGISHAGDAANPNPFAGGITNPLDMLKNPAGAGGALLDNVIDPNTGLGTTVGGAGGATAGKPVTNLSTGTRNLATDMQDGGLPSLPVPAGSRGADINTQTSAGTAALRGDIAADETRNTDEVRRTMGDVAGANPLTNNGLTQTAADQARSALGPAPTLDQGLADRGLSAVTDATRQAGQVVDAALAPINQAPVMQAQESARSVLDKALNGPDTTARIGAQTLRNQLALARSAAGGAGAAQMALTNAQAAAPELLAQANDAGIREQQAKLGVASQQTGQLAQTALGQQQNATARLDVAGKAAGVSAQAAQGARGQDIEVAKANLDSGNRLLENVSQLTGQQLQLNEQNAELLGRMGSDLLKTGFDYSQLDATVQGQEFQRWVTTYGIDVAAAAQIKAAAANNDKGVLDYLMPIIGGVASAAL